MRCIDGSYDQRVIEQLPSIFFEKPLHGVSLFNGSLTSGNLTNGNLAYGKHGVCGLDERCRDIKPLQREATYRLCLPVELTGQVPQINDSPIWSLSDSGLQYQTQVQLFDQTMSPEQPLQRLSICCEGSGCFEYSHSGIKVCWQKEGTGPEHYFQSLGLGVWLERGGVPCIHANAVAMGDGAIGILAPSQTGKTTLTAALLEHALPEGSQHKAEIMSDDMMAIHHVDHEYLVYPGWPLCRVWPNTIKNITDTDIQTLPRVHDRFEKRLLNIEKYTKWKFCQTPRPLKRLYLLDRRKKFDAKCTKKVNIETIKPAAALVHLIQNSILGGAYKSMGVERQRLATLAKLLEKVPLKRVIFKSGMEYLPQLSRAIAADMG